MIAKFVLACIVLTTTASVVVIGCKEGGTEVVEILKFQIY